jgi:hypothetical protein
VEYGKRDDPSNAEIHIVLTVNENTKYALVVASGEPVETASIGGIMILHTCSKLT